jgi:hypothetical protein
MSVKIINSNKGLLIQGYFAFLILFTFSILFYKERILFFDTVFQFFKILNFEKFNIEADRYSAIVSQIPLLLSLKMNLSIETCMYIFSVSFVVLYFIIFLIIAKTLKNPAVGLAFILIMISNIDQCFFYLTTETHQALAYSVLLFALRFYDFKNRVVEFILLTVLIVLSFFAHPVAFFCILFILAYYFVEKNDYKNILNYVYILFTITLLLVKLLTTPPDSYEGSFFSTLFNFIKNPDINFYSVSFFAKYIFPLYWVNLFSLILLTLIVKSSKHKVIFLTSSFFIFLFILFLTFKNGDSDVMMQRAYLPLSFFTILPLFYELRNHAKSNVVISSIFVIVSTISFIRIGKEGMYLHSKIQELDVIVAQAQKTGKHKFILDKGTNDYTYEIKSWAFPFMTLVYSSMKYEQAITMNFVDDVGKYSEYTSSEEKCNIFLGPDFWREWRIDDLNKKYFKLSQCELYYVIDSSLLK